MSYNVLAMVVKECATCHQVKPLTEFNRNRRNKDGLMYLCRVCARKRCKAWQQSPKGIYIKIRDDRAEKLKIGQQEFVEWYVAQPKRCVYCGIPQELLEVSKVCRLGNRGIRLSIERIDNNKDYVLGNLALACLRCNFIKSNTFSFEEMKKLALVYIQPKWKAEVSSYTI